MKKYKILYIILFVCLFSLCGCNNSSDNKNNSNVERLSTSTKAPKKETVLASFTTKILDQTPNRVNNIGLTCNKVNEVIVKKGETFSFCDTVGEVSENTGYKKADIFDAKGNILKGFGGGTCQVSSTLYNVVLQIPNLTVIERHAHSKQVYYVEKDKDATIDAPSKLDFKFRNDTNNDIKIYAVNTNEEVTVKISSIE